MDAVDAVDVLVDLAAGHTGDAHIDAFTRCGPAGGRSATRTGPSRPSGPARADAPPPRTLSARTHAGPGRAGEAEGVLLVAGGEGTPLAGGGGGGARIDCLPRPRGRLRSRDIRCEQGRPI